jgi:hypothetical protein
LPELVIFLGDSNRDLWARVAIVESVTEIAQGDPDRRDDVVEALSRVLSKWFRNDHTLNAFLIGSLADLKAVEAAPLMEAAFLGDRVDISTYGDWEDVQIQLGLLSERQTPPPAYHRNLFLPGPESRTDPRSAAAAKRGKSDRKAKKKAERVARKRNRRGR